MPAASAYNVVKAALVARLKTRGALSGVNILDHAPVNREDLRTETGVQEVIYAAGAEGTWADVVLAAGDLRFDETFVLDVVVEAVGVDTGHTQPVLDGRVNELLYELLAEVAGQQTWPTAALGLDVYDYVWFTPASQRWNQGRVEGTSAYAASVEVGLEVRARRSFT